MGSVQSNCKRRETRAKNNNNEHVLMSNNQLDDSLHFDPLQSSLLAFTINRLTSRRFQKQSLGNISNDAGKVAIAFKERGVIQRCTLYEAKRQPDSCTFHSMKAIFQQQAKEVGEGGVFIFHFTGHGIKTRDSQFGLAPVDFDFTEETYITAHVLSRWLRESRCKAKYILFIINSCYAGMLTEALTASNELHSYPGLYVMAACTANEISVAFNTLGHSIFCYFLSHAISTSEFPAGQLPIKAIYDKCSRLSTALSSLLLGYDRTTGVVIKTMHPQLMCPPQTELEETDMGDTGPRYAVEFYDSTKKIVQLDDKCRAWTEELCRDGNGGLVLLRNEQVLEQCILDTILCFMLRSVVRIQLTCNSITTVASGNLYITTYIDIVSAISRVYRRNFSRRELLLGIQHYIDCLQHSGIKELETLRELEDKIREAVKKSATQFYEEDTDSGETEVPSFSLQSTIERWEPLDMEQYLTPTDT